MQNIDVRFALTTAFLGKEMQTFKLSHVLAYHVLARLDVIAKTAVAWKAGVFLPCVTQENGVEKFGSVGEIMREENLFGQLDKPEAKRLVLNYEGIGFGLESI